MAGILFCSSSTTVGMYQEDKEQRSTSDTIPTGIQTHGWGGGMVGVILFFKHQKSCFEGFATFLYCSRACYNKCAYTSWPGWLHAHDVLSKTPSRK